MQLCIFRIDFFLFQTLQTAQLHFQNRLCLQIRQAEAFHQSLLCIIIACADNSDYLVNVVNRNPQTLQNMRSFFRLIQIKACSSGNNIFLMLQVFRKHLLQIQNNRLAIHQCKHICTEGFLQGCIFIQLVQNDICIIVLLDINDNLDIIPGGGIVQIADALYALFLRQLADFFQQTQLIDHIRNFSDDNTFSAVMRFNLRCGAHNNLAASGAVRRTNPAFPKDIRACGEIGPLDVLHQFLHIGFSALDFVLNHADHAVNDLAEVMRRNIRRHTNRNTA